MFVRIVQPGTFLGTASKYGSPVGFVGKISGVHRGLEEKDLEFSKKLDILVWCPLANLLRRC